jgi:two-component system, chemotaxis family, protein-glutamate methylesterase/glutaminase
MPSPIRVLIVDDSAVMRQILTQILSSDAGIEVVGTAIDPYMAREKIMQLKPDVLTLDVEMPRMDGLTFLEKLMRARPMPVVMISTLTQTGCDVTLRALELGAVDFVPKPTIDTRSGIVESAHEIITKVKTAAHVRIRTPAPVRAAPEIAPIGFRTTYQMIALGASTGGTEALRAVLSVLPANSPGIVVVQHMPPGYTAAFADRLDGICAMSIKEAKDGDRVIQGQVLIAPGSFHTFIVRSGAEYKVRVTSDPPVNLHRPSVDVLFDSCAKHAGKNAVAALLTGMGDDGARGLRRMRDAGARTIAQDEASCVVFGMPRVAIELGGAEFVMPLNRIPGELLKLTASIGTS